MITLSLLTLYALGVVLIVLGMWLGSQLKQWEVNEWEQIAARREKSKESLYRRLEQTEAVARAFRSSLPESEGTDG